MNRSMLAAATAAVLFSSPALAIDNPSSISGATIVSVGEARAMIEAGVPVFDVRSKNEFAEGHVAGAHNVPYKERSPKVADFDGGKDKFDLSKLPADKQSEMIFYCNGIDCWKSYKASVTAVGAGYTGVKWMRDGYPGWKAAGYPVK
ncbi:MAG: rhodanese-like domain-containing protein [Rhodocyclaceae bacterium]|nr:rhodanese-like domain-containing protein [Rhodocyclaceae bacterium]